MANKVVTWWDRHRPLRALPRVLTYSQFLVVPERLVTSDFLNRYGAYLTVQDQSTGDYDFIGTSVPEAPTFEEQPVFGAPSFSTNPSISTAMPDVEWAIPSTPSTAGQNWTRVTATNYGSPGGWAFTYRLNHFSPVTSRIRVRMFNNVLTGTAPNRSLVAYTSDILVDPTNLQYTHDEPDITWNSASSKITVAWNVRSSSPNMSDLRFRVLDTSGTILNATDSYATHTTIDSQFRPILTPRLSPQHVIVSFTGDDSAYFTALPNASPYVLPSPPGEDIAMAPVIGTHRQTDQDAVVLPDGSIFCAWTHVEGKSRIRWRVFNSSLSPVTAGYTELPLQLQFGKAEPRVKYHNGKIWIVYHEEWAGGEYNGVNVWGTVYNYTSPLGITVHKPEFCLHAINLNGLQRKPELILWGDRALVVFEHYPRGIINATTEPSYIGGSVIVGRLFDLGGTPITPVTRISTTTSFSGPWRFMLRPDIEKSLDNSRAVVCWTATATGNIYSAGSNAKIWARVIDLSALP